MLLNSEQFKVEEAAVEAVFQEQGWEEGKDFSWSDIEALVGALRKGGHCPEEAFEAVAGDTEMPSDEEFLAQLAEAVETRIENKSFPLVLPSEVKDVEGAKQSLALIDKEQAVLIQSYLDEQRAEFLRNDTVAPEVPRELKIAYFARNSYYYHVRQFLLQKSLNEKKLAHHMQGQVFIPLLPVTSLSSLEMRERASDVLGKIRQQHVFAVEKQVWEQWANLEENLVPYGLHPV